MKGFLQVSLKCCFFKRIISTMLLWQNLTQTRNFGRVCLSAPTLDVGLMRPIGVEVMLWRWCWEGWGSGCRVAGRGSGISLVVYMPTVHLLMPPEHHVPCGELGVYESECQLKDSLELQNCISRITAWHSARPSPSTLFVLPFSKSLHFGKQQQTSS